VWLSPLKPATWASYNGELATLVGSRGIIGAQKLGAGRYRFFFATSKGNYSLSGSSSGNSAGLNTWVCDVKKHTNYVDVSTCDTIPNLSYVDTPSLDVLIMDF
jgi:hypothetical protein